MDRFHENENGILVATDVAARGLDILGVRIVVHYQLPHSAEDKKNWFDRNASSLELVTENYDSEEAQVNKHKQMKTISRQLKKLQKELEMLILHPLQSKTFLHRYLAGALSLLCLYFTISLTFLCYL
ncbi:DEAD-box ATP-dependent RNA helicase 13 [Glycine max]|nr:DEAD-box ATP-dependent RNA helicase 13 [Glycine max]